MNEVKRACLRKLADWRRLKYEDPVLHHLFLEVTAQCNEHCLHCGSSCEYAESPMVPTDKLLGILADVRARLGTRETLLCVTGGEPLLRKDFFDLMAGASELGFKWGMTTNGTLITPEVARKLAECNMGTVSVSVDGLPDVHDRFRGRTGSFDLAMRGVQNLIDVGAFQHVQVTSVITKWSIGDLDEMFDQFNELDIDSWRVTTIEPMGRALEHPELMLDYEDIRTLLEFVRDKRLQGWPLKYGCCHYLGGDFEGEVRDTYFICNAGIYTASIMANGDLGSCLDIARRPETIQGNVYTDDFVDTWLNRFEFFRRDLCELDEQCDGCTSREFCAGGSWHSFDFDNARQRVCLKGTLFD